ncbi:hypothetical protein [Bradyrhizobium guangdongense]|uniref:hypothetical protein n=1 Tax=Bradyrhizobium guangdongense TaxID=1325090 RepID=UPI00131A0B08|nr:hypothetical protein [Bradyrhizobium guangdongense]
MLIDDVEGRRRWRRTKDASISVPVAHALEIEGFQDLIRFDRICCRAFPHAKFAIRSILVRRTRIELGVDYLSVS